MLTIHQMAERTGVTIRALRYYDKIGLLPPGAETGNRKGKVIPEKSWIDELAYCSAQQKTPIFMKSSLRGIMGVDFVQQFPWDK